MGQARLGVPKIHTTNRTPNALGRPMSLKTKIPNHAQACQEHEDCKEVTPKVGVQDQKGDNRLRSKRRTTAKTGGRRQEAGGRRQEAGGRRQEASSGKDPPH